MENRKIHVAITHGDTNGIGYELIFKTFSDPSLLELCTPVIYGSPKVATYHRNALNLQANFTIISKPEDARDGKINMLTTFDDEISHIRLRKECIRCSRHCSSKRGSDANNLSRHSFPITVSCTKIICQRKYAVHTHKQCSSCCHSNS